MVDPESRKKARELIRKFADGALTNDEFTDQYPRSEDRAVRVVMERLWFFWDDFKTHRLEEDYKLDTSSSALLTRCIEFLSTDLEYTGPAIGGTLLSGIKNTWKGWLGKAVSSVNEGDVSDPWWPFSSEEQFRQHGPAPQR